MNNSSRQDAIRRGQTFINEVYQKMSRIAEEFAAGDINRTQFHRLYNRYQRQIMTVSQMIAESDPSGWEDAVSSEDENTLHIRKKFEAKAQGISIYDNRSGMPIETIGDFSVDPELIVPMLSSYREATAEIFQAGVRSTEMEDSSWLCFMAGAYSTLIVRFSVEPSSNRINLLDRMHRDFEIANAEYLEHGYTSTDQLAYPFFSFIKQSKFDTAEFDDSDGL